MSGPGQPVTERSYGCTFGCGNSYDYIFIDVRSGTLEMLCLPCLVRLMSDILSAVTEPDPGQVAKWLHTISPLDPVPMKDGKVKPRGHNAPATSDDPALFDSYDSVITADELPEEFR